MKRARTGSAPVVRRAGGAAGFVFRVILDCDLPRDGAGLTAAGFRLALPAGFAEAFFFGATFLRLAGAGFFAVFFDAGFFDAGEFFFMRVAERRLSAGRAPLIFFPARAMDPSLATGG
ncbi:MAG: hypothetical protein K8I27_06370 [Planctomycetes bacterium]|nr:hypothetical protein [Planctomycetota bacterium]